MILRNEKNAKKKKKSTVLNNRALRLLTNPPLAKKVGLSVVWKLFVCTKSFALRAFSPPSAAVPGGITAFITFLPESFAPFGAAQTTVPQGIALRYGRFVRIWSVLPLYKRLKRVYDCYEINRIQKGVICHEAYPKTAYRYYRHGTFYLLAAI